MKRLLLAVMALLMVMVMMAACAQLLGKRVRVVPVEQVLRGYKKGEGWPKDPTTMGLMPGVRPPRNWRSPVDQ